MDKILQQILQQILVAQMLAPAHSVLTSVLRKSEAFYQAQPDPL